MIEVPIVGLREGLHPVDIVVPTSEIPGLPAEFTGDVHVNGTLRKVGKRLLVSVEAEASMNLICDRSAEEYTDTILVDVDLEYVFDVELANKQESIREELDFEDVRGLRDDEKIIDLAEEVRQELIVHMPLRRVAPKYRNMSLAEIYPAADVDADETAAPDVVDERWAALRKIAPDNDANNE